MKNDKLPFNFNEKGEDDSSFFPVPDGYFDKLPDLIINRIKSEENAFRIINESANKEDKSSGVVIQLITIATSIAAVFLITIGISNYFNDGTKSLASSITATDIIESEVLFDLDENLIAEQISVADVEEMSLNFVEEEKEIEEYLIDQNSDISTVLIDY